MTDPLAGSALIIALLSGATSLLNTLHLRKIKCGENCQSECSKGTSPPNSPHPISSKETKASIQDKKHNDNISV